MTAGQDVTILSISIPSNASRAIIRAHASSTPGGSSAVFADGYGILALTLNGNSFKKTHQVYAEGNYQYGSSDGTLTSTDETLIPGDYIHEVYIDNYGGTSLVIKARDVSSVVDTGVVSASVEFLTS